MNRVKAEDYLLEMMNKISPNNPALELYKENSKQ